jgi:2-dehydropantoate 2-reductase
MITLSAVSSLTMRFEFPFDLTRPVLYIAQQYYRSYQIRQEVLFEFPSIRRDVSMQKINRIAILGAGAMGGFFTERFLDAPGFSTAVVARGQRRDRLNNDGLVVNGKKYAIPVVDPAEETHPADLIIVAVKHHHLIEAAHDLKNLVDSQTIIISVMNGLDSEEYIGSIYGMEKMLYAISVGIDSVREGNRITFTKPGMHYFGEADNSRLSQPVLRVQDAFDRAGISHETPSDMIRMIWWKFMINVGINQASAVTHAPYGVFQSSPEAQGLMEALMREVLFLAKVLRINLVEQDIDDWYDVLNTLAPHGKTSMLQDIEAGRKTEVEAFGGKVVELGNEHGVPTPVNRTVTSIIRTLERNAG